MADEVKSQADAPAQEVPQAQVIPLGAQPVRPVKSIADMKSADAEGATAAKDYYVSTLLPALEAGLKAITGQDRYSAEARNHILVYRSTIQDLADSLP